VVLGCFGGGCLVFCCGGVDALLLVPSFDTCRCPLNPKNLNATPHVSLSLRYPVKDYDFGFPRRYTFFL